MRKLYLLVPLLTALAVTGVTAPAQAQATEPPAVSDAENQVAGAIPGEVVPVTPPARLSDGISVQTSAGRLTVLPVGAATSTVHRTAAGRAVYLAAYQATTTVYQREDNRSARIVNVLGTAQAPQAYHWDFHIAGATTRLAPRPDGSVAILRVDSDGTSTVVGAIAAPWALDGDNKPVRTYYGVSGARLTQVVLHGSTTVYPVTADPRWAWG